MTNIVEELPEDIDETIGILEYIQSTSDEGRPYWAYLIMKPSRYQEYRQNVADREVMRLMQYGTVVEQGWGKEAPESVKKMMIETYGARNDFEDVIKSDMMTLARDMQSKEAGHE